ncbi:copper chaperone PCu(A)C [Halomonas sp. TRM85114]|uniref:copper chaperone PCu(A)C n=1 Tax=Halomonas jincaotanensis TaxID=2810616 RepID=UPI001BD4D091|nr:copper chaperone PCu(A)C [Halomonas jincaotanensis]MBS9402943.1 copper chaperone PCu(A)C [Halomonas jincaotanensis]
MRLFLPSLTALMLALASHMAVAQSVTVENAQVRAVPPVSTTSAAFMVLHNAGDEDVEIVAASSPAAEVLELHEHQHADGVMQMRHVSEVSIPAGGSTELAPGGLHLMLINLTQSLDEGERVAITLEFANGETLSFEAPVLPVNTRQQASHGKAH